MVETLRGDINSVKKTDNTAAVEKTAIHKTLPHKETRTQSKPTPLSTTQKNVVIVNINKDDVRLEEYSVSDEGSEENDKPKWGKYSGLLLTVCSSLVFSITSLIVKYLKGYDAITIALWRYQGTLLPAVPMLLFGQYQFRKKERVHGKEVETKTQSVWAAVTPLTEKKKLKMFLLLLTRSMLTCNALILHFYSLKYMPLGDSLVISSSTPVFVTLFAHYFLKEKCGIVPILLAVFTVCGVVVISKPPHLTSEKLDFDTLIGAGLALGCMLLATFSYVVLRYIRKVHYAVTTLMFGTWGTIETAVLATIFGVLRLPEGAHDWLLAALLALLNFIGQISIILAMKCEQAGPVSLIKSCDVVFAFAWQIIFLQEHPDIFSIVGALIVLFGVVITALRKWAGSLSVDDPTRKRLRVLLM